MNLPGRLARTTLGDLLGTLHRAGATGVLELVEAAGVRAGRRHRVHLMAGLVDAVETDADEPRLGELLAREGMLDARGFALLLDKLLAEPERSAGEILVHEQLASEALVGAALRWQLRARLDAVFRLVDGEVRFHVRRPPRSGKRPAAVLTPREFLHGRRRARAEGGSRAAGLLRAANERNDACRVLGVPADADPTAVRQAYRRLAAAHHPDRHPGASAETLRELVQRFTRITAAYQSLAGK